METQRKMMETRIMYCRNCYCAQNMLLLSFRYYCLYNYLSVGSQANLFKEAFYIYLLQFVVVLNLTENGILIILTF